MIIIGERINASRPRVKEALDTRNSKYIQDEAQVQINNGAEYLDMNCGLSGAAEPEDMEWLIKTVREISNIPLCIDSPNPEAIERGIAASGNKDIINSITAEESRYVKILPLALKHDCGIVALTMDEKGMPDTADERFEVASRLFKILKKEGVEDRNMYFDPLVRPISSEPRQAKELLKAIPKIKSLGDVKVLCGISNISYGLPRRKLINATFLSLALNAGLDGAIVDPLDKATIAAINTTEALLGKDNYCMKFIQNHRKGLF